MKKLFAIFIFIFSGFIAFAGDEFIYTIPLDMDYDDINKLLIYNDFIKQNDSENIINYNKDKKMAFNCINYPVSIYLVDNKINYISSGVASNNKNDIKNAENLITSLQGKLTLEYQSVSCKIYKDFNNHYIKLKYLYDFENNFYYILFFKSIPYPKED